MTDSRTPAPTRFLVLQKSTGDVHPALQVQLVKAVLPAGEVEFVGQSLHKADPADALYLPATHAAHGPPSGPVDPALQVQFVKATLPAGELEFDGQAVHVELDDDPTAVEYVPAPQSVQEAVPVNALYFPATHAVHGSPSSLTENATPAGESPGQKFSPTILNVC